MKWTPNIFLTLKTWVFKKKLLKFSERFERDPMACFYCPEMCRFACTTAEALRSNAVTPRGKMSLLHLAEKGATAEQVAGSKENRQWFLEQCTSCGRCTEYCVYEIDVASNLRKERAKYFALSGSNVDEAEFEKCLRNLEKLSGDVLISETGRKDWWERNPTLIQELGVQIISDSWLPYREWERGVLTQDQVKKVGEALSKCKSIWCESPELAWFFAKGVKQEAKSLDAEVRTVWQKFFHRVMEKEFSPETVLHESSYLSRALPILGYSIPMYERGFLPFHNGWNSWDCGGEGFYQTVYLENSKKISERFLKDLQKDGRSLKKIICQNLSCVDHLGKSRSGSIVVSYWLDEVVS